MKFDGSPKTGEFSFAPADHSARNAGKRNAGNAGKEKTQESRIFVTCRGSRFRCVPHKVERLFCALSEGGNAHVMEGTVCVLTDRYLTLCQQGGTYIVKTDQGAYADLHCLKKCGRTAKNEYPLPVGAYQKNLECEQIIVSCAKEINGKECAKSLPLALLPDHQPEDCYPAEEKPAAQKAAEKAVEKAVEKENKVERKIILDSGQDIADSTSDDLLLTGLPTDLEVLSLHQMSRSQEVTLIDEMPENNIAIAQQIGRACDSKPCSHDGTLCWKISDYSRKKQEADTGALTMLASQPFFTSTGYKLCAKVYLAGDDFEKDPAENQRFSVGVAIMQSDNDDNLKWPFLEKVTISLLDQSTREGGHHIVKSVVGREYSSNCDKPVAVMNCGLGFPDFLEGKSMDDRFLADDSLLIQIKVESLPERKHIRAKRRLAKPGVAAAGAGLNK